MVEMTLVWVGIGLFILGVLLMIWAMCKIASDVDDAIEEHRTRMNVAKWLEKNE